MGTFWRLASSPTLDRRAQWTPTRFHWYSLQKRSASSALGQRYQLGWVQLNRSTWARVRGVFKFIFISVYSRVDGYRCEEKKQKDFTRRVRKRRWIGRERTRVPGGRARSSAPRRIRWRAATPIRRRPPTWRCRTCAPDTPWSVRPAGPAGIPRNLSHHRRTGERNRSS